MALAQKNIIKTRANYRIPTIMQGCGFSKPQLKRVHQEIFLFKNPKQLAGFLPQSAGFLLSRQVSLLGLTPTLPLHGVISTRWLRQSVLSPLPLLPPGQRW